MLTLMFLLYAVDSDIIIPVKTYQAVPEEEAMSIPYTMYRTPEGRLYVGDPWQHKIYVWNNDGSFHQSFGRQGDGPGELNGVTRLTVTDKAVYAMEFRNRISVFDLEGTFIKTIKMPGVARTFAVLENEKILAGFRRGGGAEVSMAFDLLDSEGEMIRALRSWPFDGIIGRVKGDNNFHLKAYGPEIDLQRGPDGHLYYGYSYFVLMHSMDNKGNDRKPKIYKNLITGKPTDDEIEIYKEMSFPTMDGTRQQPSKMNGLKIHYDYEMPYYTHFLMLKDKILFVTTPIGGTNGVGNSYSKASYYILDRATDKIVHRGRYALPEDSQILYRDGHAVAFIADDESGEYQIMEVKLKGM